MEGRLRPRSIRAHRSTGRCRKAGAKGNLFALEKRRTVLAQYLSLNLEKKASWSHIIKVD
jgi:hypothetical protein